LRTPWGGQITGTTEWRSNRVVEISEAGVELSDTARGADDLVRTYGCAAVADDDGCTRVDDSDDADLERGGYGIRLSRSSVVKEDAVCDAVRAVDVLYGYRCGSPIRRGTGRSVRALSLELRRGHVAIETRRISRRNENVCLSSLWRWSPK
jgi:hypothetical protein